MRIAAATNVLVRAITGDDPVQSPLAQAALEEAELVAIATPALCELVWVLSGGYGFARDEIADAIQRLVASEGVVVDSPAVDAGLAAFEAGADFADGVIAIGGLELGADVFLSFDQAAVAALRDQGLAARLPG